MNGITQELVSKELTDFHCLESFCSGVKAMDKFIRSDFRLSVENHYCSAYEIRKPYKDTLRMFRTLYAEDAEL